MSPGTHVLSVSQSSPSAGYLLLLACFQHPLPRTATRMASPGPPLTVWQADAGTPAQTSAPPSAGRPWVFYGPLCPGSALHRQPLTLPPTRRPHATSQCKSEKSPTSTNAHTPLETKVGWSAKAYAQPRPAGQQEDTQTPCQVCPCRGTCRVPAPPSTWGRAGPRSPRDPLGSRLVCFTLLTDLPGLRS